MGINTSSCLDEALCGKEDIPDQQTCENIKPGANFLSIEVQEEPSQIHPPPPLKLENPQNLSGSDDDDDDQNSDQESNESVMTVISPTKDIAPMRAFTRSLLQSPFAKLAQVPLSPKKKNSAGAVDKIIILEDSPFGTLTVQEIQTAILSGNLTQLMNFGCSNFVLTEFKFSDFQNKLAIHLAVMSNEVEMVKYILSFSPDLHAKDENGETPMSIAIQAGNSEVLEVLSKALVMEGRFEDSPLSPLPANSSMVGTSVQDSLEDNISVSLPPDYREVCYSFKDTDRTTNDDQSQQTLPFIKKESHYKKLLPKRIRKAAKRIAHLFAPVSMKPAPSASIPHSFANANSAV